MSEIFQGAAAHWIAREYGGRMEENTVVESIGVTASSVIPNDPERLFLLLVNLSTNLMYIGFDEQVGAGRGIFLAANGGSYVVDVREDLVLPTYQHFAVSTGNNSNLYVLSVRRFKGTDAEGGSNAN